MPRVLWLARQIEVRPGMWHPATEAIRNGKAGTFPCVWVSTNDARAFRWSVGYAVVDADQLAALSVDPNVFVVPDTQWQRSMGQAVTKVAIDQFCDQAGVARAGDAELAEDFITRLATTIKQRIAVTDLLARSLKDFGA